MRRREALRGLWIVGLAATADTATRRVSAQSSEEIDADSYEQLDNSTFPEDVSVSWVTERFIQVRNENAPVVGHEIRSSAIIIERINTQDEHAVLRNQFDWSSFDYTGSGAFSELFSAVAWPLEEEIGSGFFDTHDLLWIAGVDQSYYRTELQEQGVAASIDQEFYLLYGHTPMLFGTVTSDQSPPPGTVIDFEATVRYADEPDGPLNSGGGGYLEIKQLTPKSRLRTPDPQWQERATARFAGLQVHPRPTLSTAVTTVEYEDDLPRPQGGSLLAKRGQIAAAGDPGEGTAVEHRLASDNHELLVGDFLPSTWDDSDGSDDGTTARKRVNISIVIDTSGSMDNRDTGWYHDDGREKMRVRAAQESTNMFLDFLQDGYTVSVVEFDTNASVVHDAVVLDDRTRTSLKGNVNRLSPRGDTSIGAGLQVGHETIRDQTGRKVLLLLSDGKENEPPRVTNVLPDLRDRGIRVYTMGIGADIDEAQLESIANQTGGDDLKDTNPGEVRDFFRTFAIDAPGRARLSETSTVVEEGDVVEDDCRVDASCEDAQFAMSYEGSEMSLVITDPSGNELTEGQGISRREGDAHEVWAVEDPQPGEWSYRIEVDQVDDPQETTAQVSGSSPIDTRLFVGDDLYAQTGFVRFQLKVEDDLQRYTGAEASLEVRPPGDDAETEQLQLYDDGAGADDVTDDGIYSNYYHPTETGEYEFTAVIEGGRYPNLQRESAHTKRITSVVDDPIRPYEQREQPTEGAFNLPLLVGGAAGVAGAYYLLKRMRGSSDGGPDRYPDDSGSRYPSQESGSGQYQAGANQQYQRYQSGTQQQQQYQHGTHPQQYQYQPGTQPRQQQSGTQPQHPEHQQEPEQPGEQSQSDTRQEPDETEDSTNE